MAASRTKTIRLSHALYDAIELIAKRQKYPSTTALIEGMARYTGLTQPSHKVSLPWSATAGALQDQLDEAVLTLVKAGQGMTAAALAKMTLEEILALAEKVRSESGSQN